MKKTHFKKELTLSESCRKGDKGADVKRIQEWLCLSPLRFPEAVTATTVDGKFGSATERAVRNFQEAIGEQPTGVVTPALFERLAEPLSTAFQTPPVSNPESIHQVVLHYARTHLRQRATELQTAQDQNLGPWVRSYCDGYEGSPFKWCMGFVQSVLDQAAAGMGRDYTRIMPASLSCDVVAMAGRQNGRLIASKAIRNNPAQVRPGDVFLLKYANLNDWYHTGVITRVVGDCFETIEGNTDSKGSSNGTAVFTRTRNFRTTTIDVFAVEGL
ncbi:hypothetical protein GCM10023189_12900 [Nibrella saemangeumensis]|uniref:Peptidoglycan binding-like domain-containing protein n=1 Tax=Nibrella saemangeumensis TaxID=1084526 RepID=A0ABP8MLN5_9BACT